MPDAAIPSEIVEIIGVVSSHGGSGGQLKGRKDWTFSFIFDRWKVRGGRIRKSPLTLFKQTTARQLDALEDKAPPDTVIRVMAEGISLSRKPRATLIKIVGPDDTEPKLNEYAAELCKAVTFEDDRFGTFMLDRTIGTYSVKSLWNGNQISLSIKTATELPSLLSDAKKLWAQSEGWEKRILGYAVESLLELKNESWLEDGESPVTAEVFARQLRLESISIYPNGRFEFWFNDGDLFWGHSVVIQGNVQDGPTDARI